MGHRNVDLENTEQNQEQTPDNLTEANWGYRKKPTRNNCNRYKVQIKQKQNQVFFVFVLINNYDVKLDILLLTSMVTDPVLAPASSGHSGNCIFHTSAMDSFFSLQVTTCYTSADSTTIYGALKLSVVMVSIAFIFHTFSAHTCTSRLTAYRP